MADTTADAPAISPSVSDALDAFIAEGDSPVVDQTPEPEVTAPEVVEKPAAEPEPEPTAAEPDDLTALAEEAVSYYGMSQEEVDRAGDLLPWVLARMDKQASVLMQGQSGERDQQLEPAPAPTQREPEKTREPIAEPAKFELPINREDFDEGSLKIFDAQTEQINKLLSTVNQHREAMQMLAQVVVETHGTASQLREKTESASNSERDSSLDEFFSKLPDEYASIYGREPMSELGAKPSMADARNALLREMNILADFDKKGGRPARGIKEQAARTLRALHADKEHAVARREADKQLKARAAKGIARPSGRGNPKNNDLASRRTRAMAAMDGPLAKLGLL